MKHSWKLCVIFGSMFVVVVMGALLLLNGAMASADGERREVRTGGAVSDSGGMGVSGPAISERKKSGEPEPEAESESIEKDFFSANASIAYGMEKRPLGEIIATFAAFWQGVPYMYGGASLPDVDSIGWVDGGINQDPEINSEINWTEGWGDDRLDVRGVDSSGFVQAVFKYYKIDLPRSCRDQEKAGEGIQIKDAKAGDLIFYGANADEATHCGIYLGDGKVVHSSSKEGKVIISDMNYRKIISVRRVTGDSLDNK